MVLKQILNIAHYEIMHIFRDRILFLIVFIVPVLYAALFGTIYGIGTLQKVPLGIVDLDNSSESRAVISAFENTREFKVIPEVNSYGKLETGMKNGAVRAGVVIPEDYSAKLSQHQLTEIATIYDGSNLILGLNTRKYFQQVLNNFSVSHTSSDLGGLGLTKKEITNVLDMISFRMQIWYNPTLSYVSFLFMGLVIMILHQIGLLGIGLTVLREKEGNSWIQFLCTGVSPWKVFLGKALPYFIVNFFNYSLLLWIAARFVNVKIEGSLSLIIIFGLLFDVIIVSIGFVISLYARNSLQVTRYLMLLSVPLLVISGYTWPSTHIPEVINGLARLMPYTWMADAFRLATLKNLSVDYLGMHLAVLAVIALGSAMLAMTWSNRNAE